MEIDLSCRAIDDFITALSNIKSLNMERLNTLTKYSSTITIIRYTHR
ncbi:hypothetical protein [Clostridioides difficile]|nr:hypothetical protein [Clostridioides difficile]